MYRTHTCGELRIENVGDEITLSGWVQKIRNLGGMTFIDLRDRYGITQLAFDENANPQMTAKAREVGREYVIQVKGNVIERHNKNKNLPTGDIEINCNDITILSKSDIPPFTIEEDTDGGDELRMKYRYLDLRRAPLQRQIALRHKVAQEVRKYLNQQDFFEIETPVLIKSTPEGARDFVVPSRMNQGQFYALPQSPQVFKQLLMVSGYDRYYQIVKCFRDEDLRADRQPEFTQIDCEMSFAEQDDVLSTFESMTKAIFKNVLDVDLKTPFHRMPYSEAMAKYGNDKPDLRFGMEIHELSKLVKGHDFKVFDSAEYIGGICAQGLADYSRKDIDKLTKWVQRPQIGAKGLVYVKYNEDGSFKSSVDKFYDETQLKTWAEEFNAKPGDLILILAGDKPITLHGLSELRLEMGNRLGLRDKNTFVPLWVVDFPLVEWDEESKRYHAMHHPFTAPKPEDAGLLNEDPGKVRANAYDLVINGVEIGGGSVRIHDQQMQQKMFEALGFTKAEAENQFGFLMNAFKYGAPPHAGIAFGFDRLVSLIAQLDSIRDVIAFPKNNNGRDVMIDSPSGVAEDQLAELGLKLNLNKKDTE
ncbi:Aspartate--tRNA ligase [Salinivirga cyanobacteriivorans]|uniref:Aspartate--tRNA ligase n=1 Tax=Salinivirga cyanobacteriivorans TaxID=1307839 RepID=A0A0S2HZD4_9BACT|nr:aspartate--tRNA ligase [Salinivirga cyanobacteriivorans]ALO15301.1 Aspartate--tRNA ligase [Salinivirga cyanobacteriivorans]